MFILSNPTQYKPEARASESTAIRFNSGGAKLSIAIAEPTAVQDVAEVVSGYAFKSTWFLPEGTHGTKIIRIGDLQNGRVDGQSCVQIDENDHPTPERFRAKSGDILMALSGATTGKTAIVDSSTEGSLVNQRVALIRSDNDSTQRLLKYAFDGPILDRLIQQAGGVAQPNLSPTDLKQLKIPLPPLSEQKRIADILDKADAIRRKRQQAIEEARELNNAAFMTLFGDPVHNPHGFDIEPLGEMLEFLTSGSRGWAKYYSSSGSLFFRIQNVGYNEIKLNDVAFVDPPMGAEANRTRVQPGDVLLSVTADLGRTCVIPNDVGDGYIN